ncbi:AraC family transcriptional regulator [Streptomyces sp. WMMC500]|uniref:AraC family transcriptional regulator n=1 Tax=Streptomyces sp. WMMC500 TaxID=3015154 RepID=UPI00248CAF37|nr:AraC family transcriptional regulator [Streptomyces sp. WMMC500]WBB58219.1 AraC family transcriptional regulator [Streptomyces sp. WMMC500]
MKPRYEQPGVPDGTTLTCFIRRQEAFDFAWHHHREYELTLITEGTGTRYVGTTVERYRVGDLVLIGPDLPHTFTAAPYATGMAAAVVAQFRHDFLGPGFFDLPQFRATAALLTRSAARGVRYTPAPPAVHALLADLPALDPAAQTLGLLDALHRLAHDATGTPITGPGYAPTPGTAIRDRIDTVCRHLEHAHTHPVHLAEIAALVHMSPTSFSRFFRRAMGRTLTEYVNQLRVETACRLLTGTTQPITEVAARSGFRNLSNFNRRFRELKRLRPRDYRAAHRPHDHD